jgi:hypothetical protein
MKNAFWWVADILVSAVVIAVCMGLAFVGLTTMLFLVTLARVLAGRE